MVDKDPLMIFNANLRIEVIHVGETLPESLKAPWTAHWGKVSEFPSHTYLWKEYPIIGPAEIEFAKLRQLFDGDPHLKGHMRLVKLCDRRYEFLTGWFKDSQTQPPWGDPSRLLESFTKMLDPVAEVRIIEENSRARKMLEKRLTESGFSLLQLPNDRVWSLLFQDGEDALAVLDTLGDWFCDGGGYGIRRLEMRDVLRCKEFTRAMGHHYKVLKRGCGKDF